MAGGGRSWRRVYYFLRRREAEVGMLEKEEELLLLPACSISSGVVNLNGMCVIRRGRRGIMRRRGE